MDDDIIRYMFKNVMFFNLADSFIKLALNGGGSDNVTVVIMFDADYNNEGKVVVDNG